MEPATAGTEEATSPPRPPYPIMTGARLATDPYVFIVGLPGPPAPLSMATYDSFLDTPDRMYFFFSSMWTLLDENYRVPIVAMLKERVERFPQHKYVLLLNDAYEYFVLDELRGVVDIHVWNSLCQLDVSRIAPPGTPVAKRFDAVLNSRLAQYKRIELARDVENLCFITLETPEGDINMVRRLLPRAHAANYEGDTWRHIWDRELTTLLASARTGVIVSRLEGFNWATGEYLLCGLPVVTTPNWGGRDRFLTPGNSLFVNDNPAAVAAGVKFMMREAPDGAEIRRNTIEAFARERAVLFDIINGTLRADGNPALDPRTTVLPHKASNNTPRLDAMFALAGREPPALDALRPSPVHPGQ